MATSRERIDVTQRPDRVEDLEERLLDQIRDLLIGAENGVENARYVGRVAIVERGARPVLSFTNRRHELRRGLGHRGPASAAGW